MNDIANSLFVGHGVVQEKRIGSDPLFESLFKNAPFGIAYLDDQLRFVRVSDKMAEVNGHTPDFHTGKTLAEVLPELAPVLEPIYRDVLLNKIPINEIPITGSVPAQTGVTRTWSASFHPVVNNDGNIVGILTFAEELTDLRRAESQIVEQEGQFRTLIDGIKDYAIFLIDKNGYVTSWNSGAERIKGYSAVDILGKHFSTFYSKEAVISGHPENELKISLETGRYEEEGERIRKDGTTFCASVIITPLFDDAGQHFGYAKVTRDISEKKLAEQSLRQSEEQFRRVFNDAATGIAIMDLSGRFIDANASFRTMVGYSVDELRETDAITLTHPEDRAEKLSLIRDLLEGKLEHFVIEKRYVKKDGGTVWSRSSASAQRSTDGEMVGLIAITENITQQHEALEAMRVSEERFRLLARASNDAIWDWDIGSDTVWWNEGLENLFGHSIETGTTRSGFWVSHLHPNDRDAAVNSFFAVIDSDQESWTSEYRFGRADGSFAHVMDRGYVIRDENQRAIRVIGGMADLTERRSLETQLLQSQRLDAIGQLAGGIAHDFNNLLTVINGYSELVLRRTNSDDQNFKAMSGIHEAGKRAEALTRQLLAFSRRQVLEPKIVDLNQVIENMELMLRRLIGEDVVLVMQLDDDPNPVRVDPGQFEQILINLALNARDAMPRGGQLLVETENIELDAEYCHLFADLAPGPFVMLAVTDTGIGIPERNKERIFEPFFTTKDVGKGTGLGLATVFGIVKQSEGHLAMYSEQGVGSTFKIYLPAVGEGIGSDRSEEPNSLVIPQGDERILLVEDETAVRILAKQALEECGYTVYEAFDGEDAVDRVRSKGLVIDILVSDVVMPHLGGRELAEKIVEIFPECKILFLSGYTEDAIIRHGIIESEFSFLQKPFTPSALARKVREVLDL